MSAGASAVDPDLVPETEDMIEQERLKQMKLETQMKARKLQIMQGTKTLVDQANAITKNRR